MPMVTAKNQRDYIDKELLITQRKHGKSIYLPQGTAIYLPRGEGIGQEYIDAVFKNDPSTDLTNFSLKEHREKKQGSGIETTRQTEESLYPKYGVNDFVNAVKEVAEVNEEIVQKVLNSGGALVSGANSKTPEGKGFQIVGIDDD